MSTNNDIFVGSFNEMPINHEDQSQFLLERFKIIGDAINDRTYGVFTAPFTPTGNTFDATTGNNRRPEYRQTILYDTALPNAGTATIAHGLPITTNFRLTNLYLSASDPTGNIYFSCQYNAITPASINIRINGANVEIITTEDYSAFTNNVIIIEFLLIA